MRLRSFLLVLTCLSQIHLSKITIPVFSLLKFLVAKVTVRWLGMIQTVHVLWVLALIYHTSYRIPYTIKKVMDFNKLVELTGCQELPWIISIIGTERGTSVPLNIKREKPTLTAWHKTSCLLKANTQHSPQGILWVKLMFNTVNNSEQAWQIKETRYSIPEAPCSWRTPWSWNFLLLGNTRNSQ